jgi:hypothetical protein
MMMNKLPKNPLPFALKGCYLAGGAILSAVTKSEISDYDIYPKSKKEMIDAFYQIEESNSFIVSISNRAITFKCNDVLTDSGERATIQVMIFDEFESPEKIFECFDFSVCMGAFDCDTEEYHFGADFWQSVASRTLFFNPKTRYPLNSAIRVGKYTSKGYFLPRAESIKLSLAVINSGMPKSWDELERVIGGTYGKQLRLDVKDTEFSYENALNVLSDMVLDFSHYENAEDYSNISAENLETFFSLDTIKYMDIRSHDQLLNSNSYKVILDSKGDLRALSLTEEELLAIIGVNVEKLDPETRLEGYKILTKKDDDSYENVIYSGKKIRYVIGDEFYEPNSPHIFVHPKTKKYNQNGKNVKCIFSFLVKDIKKVAGHEYTVSMTRFERLADAS